MAIADWRLAIPTVLWFAGYIFFLRYFVPRMRDLAKASSELRSLVMGRVVDSYTNILTVKLFARARDEDAYVREVVDDHTGAIAAHMRLITRFMAVLSTMNAMLLVSTAAIGITLWGQGHVERRRGGDRLAARVADRQRRRLGELGSDRHLREHRRRAGRHGDDRRAARPGRPAGCARTRGAARRDPLRAPVVHLWPQGRQARARRPRPHDPAGRAGGPRRALGCGQVHARQPAAALPRDRGRQHPHRRPGHPLRHAGEPARGDRHGHAGHVAPAPVDRAEHRLRPSGRHRGRDRGRGAQGAGAWLHPRPAGLEAAHRLRRARRRAGREALRRPAPAHRDRARDPQGRADPRARRSHVGARQRSGTRDPGPAAGPDGRQDGDRDRAPALDDRADGPADRARRRPRRRAGHARRTAARERPLRDALAAPVRRLPAARHAGRRGGGRRATAARRRCSKTGRSTTCAPPSSPSPT